MWSKLALAGALGYVSQLLPSYAWESRFYVRTGSSSGSFSGLSLRVLSVSFGVIVRTAQSHAYGGGVTVGFRISPRLWDVQWGRHSSIGSCWLSLSGVAARSQSLHPHTGVWYTPENGNPTSEHQQSTNHQNVRGFIICLTDLIWEGHSEWNTSKQLFSDKISKGMEVPSKYEKQKTDLIKVLTSDPRKYSSKRFYTQEVKGLKVNFF